MIIYVDQSGKVEYTSHDTVVAYSNGKAKSVLIKAADKRKVQAVFRDVGKSKMFAYKTFAVLVYLLVRDEVREVGEIVIDPEYPGHKHVIKNILLQIMRRHHRFVGRERIHFRSIGKHHAAHKRAIEVFRGRRPPDLTVAFHDVLDFIV
jgi:hypothetical protein